MCLSKAFCIEVHSVYLPSIIPYVCFLHKSCKLGKSNCLLFWWFLRNIVLFSVWEFFCFNILGLLGKSTLFGFFGGVVCIWFSDNFFAWCSVFLGLIKCGNVSFRCWCLLCFDFLRLYKIFVILTFLCNSFFPSCVLFRCFNKLFWYVHIFNVLLLSGFYYFRYAMPGWNPYRIPSSKAILYDLLKETLVAWILIDFCGKLISF